MRVRLSLPSEKLIAVTTDEATGQCHLYLDIQDGSPGLVGDLTVQEGNGHYGVFVDPTVRSRAELRVDAIGRLSLEAI